MFRTKTTTWATWLVVWLLTAANTASATTSLLSGNSHREKLRLVEGVHQVAPEATRETYPSWNEFERQDAADDVVAPSNVADDVAFGRTRAQREASVASRPERYRKWVEDTVWRRAQGADGKVYDTNTLEELTWDRLRSRDGQWDMGHIKDKSYDQLKKQFLDGEISRKQFLDEYNNPANYRPEARSANRSRRYQ